MDLIGIATQLDKTLGAMAGVRSHYPQHPDTVGATPCVVIGMAKGTTRTGSQQRTQIEVPVRIYLERISDDARVAADVSPWVNAVIAALAPINSAQSTGLWAVITGIDWDTDKYYAVGGSAYAAIDFTLHMEQIETVSTYGAI